jgi:putative redox protein
MQVIVNHLGAVQFEVKARNHAVYCDQPLDAGGFDEGITPPEFLLAALGTCAGYYAVEYAKGHRIPVEGLQVRVSAEKAKKPVRLDDFKIDVLCPQPLEAHHREGILRAVHACLIHNTLTNPPKITTKIEAPEIAQAA